MRKILLMLAMVASFALQAQMPCMAATPASHCPMHSTTAPCCRVAGCVASVTARHEVASPGAPAQVPTPPLPIAYLGHARLNDLVAAIGFNPSPPNRIARNIEFRPLLI